MTTVSISQLKTQPAKTLDLATDYPVAVGKRNHIQAYLIGKNLYERLISYIEDYVDQKVAREANFRRGKAFEKVAKQLGV